MPDKQFVKQEIEALEVYVNDTLKKLRKLFATSEELDDQIKETVWHIEKKYVCKEVFDEF